MFCGTAGALHACGCFLDICCLIAVHLLVRRCAWLAPAVLLRHSARRLLTRSREVARNGNGQFLSVYQRTLLVYIFSSFLLLCDLSLVGMDCAGRLVWLS